MQFKKLIIKLTKKFLKRDLEISNDLPLSYLIGVCLTRFAMMIRGKFTFGFKKRGKRFFRGKKVELHCKKYRSFIHTDNKCYFLNKIFSYFINIF